METPGRSPLFLDDEHFRRECREDRYRASGPGGQKRNKTSNAVRLTHLPTGLVATSTEWRSLKENQLHALRRLRLRIAADVRTPIDLARFEPPDWFLTIRRQRQIEASHRHAYYAPAAQLVLDLLKASAGNVAVVGVNLGVTTTAVVKLLESDPHLWTAANAIRADLSMPALTPRK